MGQGAGGGLAVRFGKYLAEFFLRNLPRFDPTILKLQSPSAVGRTVRWRLMRQQGREEQGPTGAQFYGYGERWIDAIGQYFTVDRMVVTQGPPSMLSDEQMHTTIFDGRIVQSDPTRSHQIEGQPVEVGVVLVPGLLRPDEGWLGERHRRLQDHLLANQITQESLNPLILHELDEYGMLLIIVVQFSIAQFSFFRRQCMRIDTGFEVNCAALLGNDAGACIVSRRSLWRLLQPGAARFELSHQLMCHIPQGNSCSFDLVCRQHVLKSNISRLCILLAVGICDAIGARFDEVGHEEHSHMSAMIVGNEM